MSDSEKKIGIIGNPGIHRSHCLPSLLAVLMPPINFKPPELHVDISADDMKIIRDSLKNPAFQEKTMSTNLTFDDHKSDLFKAMSGMRKSLEPLNERLKPLEMMLWVADGLVWINRHAANDESGGGFFIDNIRIEEMLAMTDEQLIKKLRN
ncbi:hypothetical protein ACTXJ5_05795 [Psychrobacter alimentarius]|uniref:hypothetical protein n=1 Tax=Psychrobacter alimentarius TaxID=261164 RepID=UPI003FD2B252